MIILMKVIKTDSRLNPKKQNLSLSADMGINKTLFPSEGGQFLLPQQSLQVPKSVFILFQLEPQAETGKYSEILLEAGICDLRVNVTKH